MTLRELIVFVSDCLRAPIPVDRDAPLYVDASMAGRLRSLSAPLERCTCPIGWRRVTDTAPHHPACPHRLPTIEVAR